MRKPSSSVNRCFTFQESWINPSYVLGNVVDAVEVCLGYFDALRLAHPLSISIRVRRIVRRYKLQIAVGIVIGWQRHVQVPLLLRWNGNAQPPITIQRLFAVLPSDNATYTYGNAYADELTAMRRSTPSKLQPHQRHFLQHV